MELRSFKLFCNLIVYRLSASTISSSSLSRIWASVRDANNRKVGRIPQIPLGRCCEDDGPLSQKTFENDLRLYLSYEYYPPILLARRNIWLLEIPKELIKDRQVPYNLLLKILTNNMFMINQLLGHRDITS